jgi:hypothetical protein
MEGIEKGLVNLGIGETAAARAYIVGIRASAGWPVPAEVVIRVRGPPDEVEFDVVQD